MNEQRIISIFFRFDDITAISSTEVERKLIKVFAEENVICSVGVVPEVTTGKVEDPSPATFLALNEDKFSLIKSACRMGVFDVLLHGFSHQTIRQEDPHTEFCGRTYDEQFSLIKKGHIFLEKNLETQVNGFIPPWNTYDENTLVVLDHLGIRAISANCYGQASNELANFCYVPSTVGYHGLKKAVDLAKKYKKSPSVIGVLIHPYDFVESEDERASISMIDLRKELRWLKEQNDIQLVSISQLVSDTGIDVGKSRYCANKPPFYESIIPPFAKNMRDSLIYHSRDIASQKKFKQLVITIFFYGTLLFAGGLLGDSAERFLIAKSLPTIPSLVFYFTLLFLLTIRWIHHGIIYYKPFSLFITILGSLGGTLFTLFSK